MIHAEVILCVFNDVNRFYYYLTKYFVLNLAAVKIVLWAKVCIHVTYTNK